MILDEEIPQEEQYSREEIVGPEFYVMAREGIVRRDLKAISRIPDHDISLRCLIVTTDGISPSGLLKLGFLIRSKKP